MARMARIVIPGVPHHIIQRGARRMTTFFDSNDFLKYKAILKQWCEKEGVEILAYCLMSNHVHLIVIPKKAKSLERGIGEAHRSYSRMINLRQGWQGHLWQERFHSYPMDEAHLFEAVRYVELNPVKAKIVESPEHYCWSSAPSRIAKKRDSLLTSTTPFFVSNWRQYWKEGIEKSLGKELESQARRGRPVGSDDFIRKLETITGRPLIRQRRLGTVYLTPPINGDK